MTPHITVVLVGPQGDANIGATARAMKNFGLGDLRLVTPCPHRTAEAYKWAVEAHDILEGARTFSCIDDALKDLSCAVAFTRRIGKSRKLHMTIDEAAPWVLKRSKSGGVGLIFGREDVGLTNDEIRCADATVTIPTSEAYPSLNLAQSVLISCYELFRHNKGYKAAATIPRAQHHFVSRDEMGSVIKQLDELLTRLNYEDTEGKPLHTKIRKRFEKIFGRAGLTDKDVKMFEGLIERIASKIRSL